MRLKNLFIVSVLFLIQGCQSLTIPSDDIINKEKRTIPPELLIKCEDLPEIDNSVLYLGELMQYIELLMGNYTDCVVRHDKLIKKVTPE